MNDDDVKNTTQVEVIENILSNDETYLSKGDFQDIGKVVFDDIFPETPKSEKKELKEPLLRGITAYGFDHPSYIQRYGIPMIMTGRDAIIQAQSGTGKTGTFSISALQMLKEDIPEIQTIILSPSRELANQTYEVISGIGKLMECNVVKVIGRSVVDTNLKYPNKGTILVGTPGKIKKIMDNQVSKNKYNNEVIDQPLKIRTIIIDECDKLLDDDFIQDIDKIFKNIEEESQSILISATINDKVKSLSDSFMTNPIKLLIEEEKLTLDGIKQFYVYTGKDSVKMEALLDIIDNIVSAQTIIFVKSKSRCDYVENILRDKEFPVGSIHGGLEQDVRNETMCKFRKSAFRILVCTDVIARGIDIQGVSLVFNYDISTDKATYLHRIGRSGRYGKKGVAISLIDERELPTLKNIEKHYNTFIPQLPDNFPDLF